MPRFFFHLRSDDPVDDPEGLDLPDLAAARYHAMEEARAMACASISAGILNLDHFIEVGDESGETLFTLTYGQAFEIRGDS